jgi:Fungal specific transcription factor domain
LQIAKNVNVEFDEVLPFFKQSPSDGVEDDSDLTDANTSFALPSKSSAEKLVDSFFNTWHPLFPVLHRPSFQWDFEAGYTEKASQDPAQMAQMWLVLAIAAKDTVSKVCISHYHTDIKGSEGPEDHVKFFLRARYFLRQLQWEPSVHALKALILAQIYAFQEENYDLLWHYKTIAVGWAYQHGLHRSQKKMKLGPLTTEMRKRVFWSLYVLDTFSSAIVGLPKMLDDNQIDTEFPSDLYHPFFQIWLMTGMTILLQKWDFCQLLQETFR